MALTAPLTVIADTGAIYALVDASDAWHERVVAWWSKAPRRVLLPEVILPEVCYLLQTRISPMAELHFVRSLRDGELETVAQEDTDFVRAHALMAKYQDFPLGYVDAMVMATAVRLDVMHPLTTDRRHFGVARGKRNLTLVP